MSETPDQPTCPRAGELEALHEGEAPAELRAHVAACPACADAWRWHEVLSAELALAETLVPRELDEALRVVRRREADRVARRVRRRRVALVALPAAAALVLVVAGMQLRHSADPAGPARGALAPDVAAEVALDVATQVAPDVAAEVAPDVATQVAPDLALARAPVDGDVTGDGRLDVLDAFALARALEAGESPSLEWDRDGDGRVTHADVAALAAAAVSLS